MYQALYRKWRPKTFDDVVGQPHITQTLKSQIVSGHLSHAYLFTGTRGTGKTTCAKILAKAVNCQQPIEGNPCGKCDACLGIDNGSVLDVVELDAASNNGVDQVRALRDEAVYAPAEVQKRVYIVDEVHMLSIPAFNALLKILEEPPEHLMFILATTELHKVPATILSRCQRFSFKRIQAADIKNRLLYVAQRENIVLEEEGAALLARLADGAMRDALSLLDQCTNSGGTVTKDTVLDTLGLAGNLKTAHIMNDIRRGDTAAALNALSDLYAGGKDVGTVLDEFAALTRDLLIRKTAGTGGGALMTGGYDEATMKALDKGLPTARLLQMLTRLQATLANLKNSANRRTDAELCLIELCDAGLDASDLALSGRIAQLEEEVAELRANPVVVQTVPVSPIAAAPAVLPQESEAVSEPQEKAPVFVDDSPPLPSDEDLPPLPEEVPPQFFAAEPPVEPSAMALPTAQEPVVRPPLPAVDKPLEPVVVRPMPGTAAAEEAAPIDEQFWSGLMPVLKGRLPRPKWLALENGGVVGRLQSNVLTLYFPNHLSWTIINHPEMEELLAKAASTKARRSISVHMHNGKPPQLSTKSRRSARSPQSTEPMPELAPVPEKSGFDELIAFSLDKGKDIVTLD